MASASDAATAEFLDWLHRLGLVHRGFGDEIGQDGCVFEDRMSHELYNGILLANLATKLSSKINPSHIKGRAVFSEDRKNNVNLFMKACKEAGIKPAFKTKDVENQNNLQAILKTLHQVALKLESMPNGKKAFRMVPNISSQLSQIPRALSKRFSSTSIRPASTQPNICLSNPYEAFRISSRNEHRQSIVEREEKVYNVLVANGEYYESEETPKVPSRPKSTKNNRESDSKSNCIKAIEELLQNEERYAKRLHLYKHYGATDSKLKRQLSTLTEDVGKLIELHKKLAKKLKESKDFPEVFVEMKKDFLTYGPVIVGFVNISREITNSKDHVGNALTPADLSNVRQAAVRYECDAGEIPSITDFLVLPFQHLTRYRILLESIMKEAKKIKDKGSSLPKKPKPFSLLKLEKAINVMDDVTQCVNEYKGDSDFLSDHLLPKLESFKGLSIPAQELALNYGKLEYEGIHDIKLKSEMSYKKRSLFFFHAVAILSTVSKSGGDTEFIAWRTFQVVDFNRVERKGLELTFIMYNENKKIDPKKSFQIREKNERALQGLEEKFNDLLNPIDSSFHKKKGSRLFMSAKTKAVEQYSCAHCDNFLKGRFTVGIHCPCCNKPFHRECFGKDPKYAKGEVPDTYATPDNFGISVVNDEDSVDATPPASPKKSSKKSSVPLGTEADAKGLDMCPNGSYVIYKLEDKEEYRIRLKCEAWDSPRKAKIEIVDGQYNLKISRTPESFDSLRKLLDYMIEKYKLTINMASNPLYQSDVDSEEDSDSDGGSGSESGSSSSEDEVSVAVGRNTPPNKDVHAEIDDLRYYHGELSHAEARQYLDKEKVGTYLIRRNERGELRITYKVRRGPAEQHKNVKSVPLNWDDTEKVFYLAKSEVSRASSVPELMEFCKTQGSEYELLHPLPKHYEL